MFFFPHRQENLTFKSPDSIIESGFSSSMPENKSIAAKKSAANDKSSEDFKLNLEIIENLLSIFISIFLSSMAYGILMVMIALRLEANVKNEILISLSTITQIGAGVIFSRFLPILGQKSGLVKSIIYSSLVAGVSALLLYRYFGYLPWLITIYVMGTSLFTMGVSRNTLMINSTPLQLRAIIISISTSLVAFGNALGPIILNLIKTNDEFVSFALASSLYVASIFPLLRLSKADSKIKQDKKIGVWRYVKNSPKIMFGGFCASYAMSSCSAFAIIYGIHGHHMDKAEASLLLSSFLFGTAFYIPLGFLCNHFNRRFIMIFSAIMALLCIGEIYFNSNRQNIFLMFFLLYGSLSGIKLTSMVLISEKYKSTQRLAVNSAYSRITLLGTIFGLLITGMMMRNFENKGLWISVALILTIFLIFCLGNYGAKLASKKWDCHDFSIFLQKPKTNQSIDD